MKRRKKEDSCTRDDPDLKGRDHRSCDPSCFKSRSSGRAGESEGDTAQCEKLDLKGVQDTAN